jgi:hypothetical protein
MRQFTTGLRGLRQRVVGVPRVEAGGDAGGVRERVVARVVGARRPRDRADSPAWPSCRRRSAAFRIGGDFEIFARYGVQFEGKRRALQAPEGVRQMVDGVVRNGPRAVPAGVGDGELKIGVDLFGGRDFDGGGFPLVGIDVARIGIEDKLGVDESRDDFSAASRRRWPCRLLRRT